MAREFEFVPFWNANDAIRNSLSIVLLAHVQHPRGFINPDQLQCGETERFSIDEFNEIYQGIVNAGYYIQSVYFNELDFIRDYCAHPERFESSMIYNLARNGLGDNKKTIIPAFCELVGLKYTSSPSLSCALCRNKYYFTTLLMAHNIPVPQSWFLSEAGVWANDAPPDGMKVICKPCSESASQGITESGIVIAKSDLWTRYSGTKYIIQEYIEGDECEVPVICAGNTVHVLPPVGIDLRGKPILDEKTSTEYLYGFYQLSDKYHADVIRKIQSYAKEAFELLQMEIYGRIDFRIGADGSPYVFDISTTPYTTKHSSYAFAFDNLGLDYDEIYSAIISAALSRYKI